MDWKYEDGRVYSTDENGALLAEATFSRIDDDTVDIDHTYVTPSLRGNGVAADLLDAVARYLRGKGLKAIASCSYANAWLKRNRESYQDIISGGADSIGPACRGDGRH